MNSRRRTYYIYIDSISLYIVFICYLLYILVFLYYLITYSFKVLINLRYKRINRIIYIYIDLVLLINLMNLESSSAKLCSKLAYKELQCFMHLDTTKQILNRKIDHLHLCEMKRILFKSQHDIIKRVYYYLIQSNAGSFSSNIKQKNFS